MVLLSSEKFVKSWRKLMKKLLNIFLALTMVIMCLGGCVTEKNESPSHTTNPAESTTQLHTEVETTEKETTTKETTTETTTKKKPITTKKSVTTKKHSTTKHKSTTKKHVTTEVTTAPFIIDLSDVDCEGIDPDKPMIALTFDDGPSAHTPRLLDMFKKYGGKGTFFVVGNLLERNETTVKRIVDEGHEIANHSWSHPDLTRVSYDKLKSELSKTKNKIFELTGVQPKLFRPPYGSYNKNVKNVAFNCEEAVITWSVDTIDWKTRNANSVYKSVMSSDYDGAIILCHDLHKTTVDAMDKVIPALLDEGYQLVTLSQLFAMKGKEISAGQVYYRG